MQFTTIASILAMATAVIAAPADIEARGGWGGSTSPQPGNEGGKGGDTNSNNEICSTNNQQVCCTGGLNCLIQALGSSCKGGTAFCCEGNGASGGLINVALANCNNLGGIL